MKKVNWRMIAAMVIVVLMTYFGVGFMEDDWCEVMSGVIWIVGEAFIVGILMWRELMSFYRNMFD